MRTSVIVFIALLTALFLCTTPPTPSSNRRAEDIPSEYSLTDFDSRSPYPNPIDLSSTSQTAFTENQGQVPDYVRFYVQGGGLWFSDDGVWFDLWEGMGEEEVGGEGGQGARGRGGVLPVWPICATLGLGMDN